MPLGYRQTALALALSVSPVVPATAQSDLDIDLYADLRLTSATGEPTWFRDWLGKARYGGRGGDRHTDLRLSEVSLLAKYNISWDWQVFAHAKYDPEQDKPADLVEAYVKYAPAPRSAFRYKVRAGLFFPHISRENIGIAWTSPFTITPSAINSWVGEEIRVLGLEGTVEYRFAGHKLALTGALFGMNDPAGTLLAYRGWALGDTKVGAFSQLPLPPVPSIGEGGLVPRQPFWVHPIREVDNRVGYYAAFDYAFRRDIKAGAFYYDNRADPEAFKSKQYGWHTRFWNYYLESEPVQGLKLIAQYMHGNTQMGPEMYGNEHLIDVDFDAFFFLASKKHGDYRFSGRVDVFGTDDNSNVIVDNNNEDGYALTFAASRKVGKRDSIIFEYLHISSDRPSRVKIGFAEHQENDVLQLSYRKVF